MLDHCVYVIIPLKQVCEIYAPSDGGRSVQEGSGSAPVKLEIDSAVPPASYAAPVSSVQLPYACGPALASV